jgi:hypothetical protein
VSAEYWNEDHWEKISSAPHACHVLACYLDHQYGVWVMEVVMSPPTEPYTHWQWLPIPPTGKEKGGC